MATILVVDDEQPMREFLVEMFEAAGYQALQAAHGRDALAVVSATPPDLVLSDVMMPIMGGGELCRRLKADPTTAAIPVILMSAAGRRSVNGTGADAFIKKPFDADVLEALLRRWLPSG